MLDSDSDGIDQISEYLANYSGIESVHIVSHGTDGEVRLGNTVLNADSLERYAGQIAAWGSSFTSSADILFYGCDLAATEDGELVLEALSELTGADINASDDLTGHAALGGDWDLEYVSGHIETDVIFSASVQENWYHTLATFTVTTFNDVVDAGDGVLSLREAVIAANDNSEADTIVLAAGTYDLTISGTGAAAGDLNIKSTIAIQGAGTQETSIAGAASGFDSRLFSVNNGANLTLQGMTVEGGSVSSGAAVFVFSEGSLEATDVVFRDNHSNLNSGAIFASGNVTLNRVALINNTSGDEAGAIRVSGITTLTNVTLSGNTAGDDGGAIYVFGGTLNIDHSTIAANATTGGSGGGIFVNSGTVNISNSIVADNESNSGGKDVHGTIVSNGYNIIEDNNGFTGTVGSDILGTDPGLNDLELIDDTYVHTFNTTSIAYNAAAGSTQPVDQRNVARDADADIGAFELEVVTELTVDTLLDTVDGTTTDVASLQANRGADGFISLREAIIAINNDATSDWTIFLGAGTHDLTITGGGNSAGDLDITSNITIVGVDADSSIISGAMVERIFQIQAGASLILKRLTVKGGNDGTGAAVRIDGGSLSATDVVFRDNTASASGGAIYADGDVTFDRVALINNDAGTNGGAILVVSGTTDLTNTTISGNTANNGAGIQVNGGTLNVNHVTIADNTATSIGGGLRVFGGTANVTNSIFADNSSGSGGKDVNGTIVSGGRNIIEDDNGFTGDDAVTDLHVDAGLSVLQNIDGTFVHTFATSSSAYNAATGSTQSKDQRNQSRDSSPDIGAYENPATPLVVSQVVPSAQTIIEDTTLTFTAGTATEVSVSDSSSATDTRLQITLSVNNGVLNLKQLINLTIIEGADGSGLLVIEGLESDLNAALDGMIFTPDADFNGSVTLNLETEIAANLEGQYTFDDSTADDQAAGTAADGTFNGNATTITDPERGEVLSLDGDDDFVEIQGVFDEPTDLTLAAWINFSNIDTFGGEIITLGDSVILRVNSSNELVADFFDGSSFIRLESNTPIGDGGWHHVAYSFDDAANTQTLYIDGVVVATGTQTTSIDYTAGNSTTRIGAHANDSDTDFDFNGLIDDARVYTRAISDEEIFALARDSDSASSSVAITVTSVNDAPELDNTDSFTLTSITEDDTTNSGNTVQEIIESQTGDRITDVDADAEGIAIFATSSTYGTWQYDIGLGWTDVGTVSESSSLLLRSTDSLRFVPNSLNGETATISFTAWDQSTGDAGDKADASTTGGTTAYSNNTASASITVTDVNDAPAIAQLSDDAVAAYDFEDGTDSIASGGPVISVSSPVTISDADGYTTGSSGLLFPTGDVDSTTNPVSIGTIPGVATSNEFSFTAQVRFDAGDGDRNFERIFDFGGGEDNNNLILTRNQSTNDLLLAVRRGSDITGNLIIAGALDGIEGEYHQYGVTIDATGLAKVFIDGIEVGSIDVGVSGTPNYSTWDENYIGSSNFPNNNKQFQGAIDDIGIFDRALTSSEMASLANTSTPQDFNVDENAPDTTSVGIVHGGDVDGNTLTYSILSQEHAGAFAIDSVTGEITVADGSALDFESDTSHDVVVRVSDGSQTFDETFSIEINDTVEPTQTVPGAQSLDEDGELTFSSSNATPNAVTVSDSFAGSEVPLQVTLSVNDGILNLSGLTGITIVEGADGSGSITFNGTESDINAALEGLEIYTRC